MLEPICYVYVKGSQPLLVLVNISIFHPLVPTTAFMIYWAPGSCQRLLSLFVGPPARAKDCFHDLLTPPLVPKIAFMIYWAPRSGQRLPFWFVGPPARAKDCSLDLLGTPFVPKNAFMIYWAPCSCQKLRPLETMRPQGLLHTAVWRQFRVVCSPLWLVTVYLYYVLKWILEQPLWEAIPMKRTHSHAGIYHPATKVCVHPNLLHAKGLAHKGMVSSLGNCSTGCMTPLSACVCFLLPGISD